MWLILMLCEQDLSYTQKLFLELLELIIRKSENLKVQINAPSALEGVTVLVAMLSRNKCWWLKYAV